MSVIENVARTLYVLDTHGTDPGDFHLYADQYVPIAEALIAAFPQLALEGREEWGDAVNAAVRYPASEADRQLVTHTRTVWESMWLKVQP